MIDVCQIGSRHNYAIPNMICEQGKLNLLVTDIAFSSNRIGFILTALRWLGFKNLQLKIASRIPHVGASNLLAFPLRAGLRQITSKKTKDNFKNIAFFAAYSSYISRLAINSCVKPGDIVYTMGREFYEYAYWAKSEHGAKVVVDLINSPIAEKIAFSHENSVDSSFSDRQALLTYHRKLYDRILNLADMILAPSDWVKQTTIDLFPNTAPKIRVVPYGSSIVAYTQPIKYDKSSFLFIGRDPYRKGIDILKKVLLVCHSKNFYPSFRLAGVTAEDLQKHDLQDHGFVPLGNLNANQIRTELSRANGVLLPSRCEGFPAVIPEACAFARPFVISNRCGLPHPFQDKAAVYDIEDIDGFASAIFKLSHNKNYFYSLSALSSSMVPFFSKSEWSSRLFKVLNELELTF